MENKIKWADELIGKNSKTPWIIDNKNIIELLILKKAKINIEGSDGRAPIHLAIANGNIDIMDLLKKHGAKL